MSTDTADPPLSTLTSLSATFTAFLTVAIHTILYLRNIYPSTSFLATRAYNVPVRQSRHPDVCRWITTAVDAVRTQIDSSAISRVSLVLLSPQAVPIERFVFDLSRFPVMRSQDASKRIVRQDMPRVSDNEYAAQLVDLEEQFRAALARLNTVGTKLGRLPEGCSFTLMVELRDGHDPPIRHPQEWMPVEPSLQKLKKSGANEFEGEVEAVMEDELGKDLGGVSTMPLRTVRAGEMMFECWVEEARGKEEAVRAAIDEDKGLMGSTQES